MASSLSKGLRLELWGEPLGDITPRRRFKCSFSKSYQLSSHYYSVCEVPDGLGAGGGGGGRYMLMIMHESKFHLFYWFIIFAMPQRCVTYHLFICLFGCLCVCVRARAGVHA